MRNKWINLAINIILTHPKLSGLDANVNFSVPVAELAKRSSWPTTDYIQPFITISPPWTWSTSCITSLGEWQLLPSHQLGDHLCPFPRCPHPKGQRGPPIVPFQCCLHPPRLSITSAPIPTSVASFLPSILTYLPSTPTSNAASTTDLIMLLPHREAVNGSSLP